MRSVPPTLPATIAELARRLAVLADGDTSAATDWEALVPPLESADGSDASRWMSLAVNAQLDHVDISLLIAAAAPSIDDRFVEVYAGLAGSPDSMSATVATLAAVNGLSPWHPTTRRRFAVDGPLRRAGFVTTAASSGSLLRTGVTVDERVVAWLLGDDTPDPQLLALAGPTVGLDSDEVVTVCRALQAGRWNIWIHDGLGGGASVGASALAVLGAPAVVIDLRRLAPSASLHDVLNVAWREAALIGGGVVAGPVDPVRDATALTSLPLNPVRPTILVSGHVWDPGRSVVVPVVATSPRLDPTQRRALWSSVLAPLSPGGALATELGSELDTDVAAAALSSLRLAPEQMPGAVEAAIGDSIARDEPLSLGHLHAAALAHGSSRLVDLAQRVVPEATFDDLVLSNDLMDELQSLPGRYATSSTVREEWGLGRGGGRGIGLTGLFAGPSGTGKTLAAEVVANALGVDLFIIDLSQVVDKYIGETEKNLERVFADAESVNGVLLFDEADALFGKRSEVSSAHDRHANIEVAYLLQRMERYDGIALLTTNLRGNIDEAFLRRLDVVCSFEEPDADDRLRLWQRHLPPQVPVADDVDLDALANHLVVTGGVIRNITLTAAHAAAIDARSVTMNDLVRAAAREYRKMGRLFKQPELSTWLHERSSVTPTGEEVPL